MMQSSESTAQLQGGLARGREISRGKAKTLYESDRPDLLVMDFRDDTSAFDGDKKASLADKGRVNNLINAHVMEKLAAAGVPTHLVAPLSDTESAVRRLRMVPVECVVRNIAAGSLCRRLGIEEGRPLQPPLFELFLKNDELHDPLITVDHAVAFGWANAEELERMRALSLRVNEVLVPLFAQADLLLVDYKLEFGYAVGGELDGELLLGDEFSPDGCRLWDAETRRPLDKDVFRHDLGDLVASYREVAARLGVSLGHDAAGTGS